jgi:4-hydroxy-3-methylbut-2-enyl diphosphate reductase
MGVERACILLEEQIEQIKSKPLTRIFTLGPLIHNDTVVKRFESLGVKILDGINSETDLEKVFLNKDDFVVIRAHGISKQIENKLKETGVNVVDATCTKVKKNQELAEKLYKSGAKVFFTGEPKHAETASIISYAPNLEVVSSVDDVKTFFVKNTGNIENCALLSQTTFENELFESIASLLKTRFTNIEIYNTICGATRLRQDALRTLLKSVDAVVIAGAGHSANTQRLFDIAGRANVPAYRVENAGGLSSGVNGTIFQYKRVGISAGASTPLEIVDGIEKAILKE